LTKMVNALATKLELGSPMICLYLLQNPDHYTSHSFIPFFLETFCKLVGLSSTYDYTHRPEIHSSFYLYDWIWRFTRTSKQGGNQPILDESTNDIDELDSEQHASSSNTALRFMEGHPLAKTHVPVTTRNWQNVVPNFIGPPLPRPDKEDRKFYCCTILTLFKPWRTGKDLKDENESWHESFEKYEFGEKELLYIKNMNLRYECLDARDD
ncbi:hypothetical protein BDP27DRAFT_1158215, partial [Rhodocollybia butyracea]